jgi:DNA-binding XRE family transcriptional regulator
MMARTKLTAAEETRYAEIRKKVKEEFPPKKRRKKKSPPGIPSQVREAREAQGLTWYAVAKAAGIPNSGTIRDIEEGRDAKLSNIKAIAEVLGLKLELVPS